MTVEGSDQDPGVEPSGLDHDPLSGVPMIHVSSTKRHSQQAVADELEARVRGDSARLEHSSPIGVINFDAIERRAGPAVRDLIEQVGDRLTPEIMEGIQSDLSNDSYGEPLDDVSMAIMMGPIEQTNLVKEIAAKVGLTRNFLIKDPHERVECPGYIFFIEKRSDGQAEDDLEGRQIFKIRAPIRAKVSDLDEIDDEKTPVAGVALDKPVVPAVPPKPPERLTGRKASKEPPLDFGESTDLANSLVGVEPAAAELQDSSERSVVVVKRRSPESDRYKNKPVDTDDDDMAPSAPLPGPITSRFNREEILARSSQEMTALPAPTPLVSEPPKPSKLKRFARFVFWLALILVLTVLGGYVFIDIKVGDVPSRWDGQVSVASVTSLLTYPPFKPEPVVIPLEDRPLVMAEGAQVVQIRERWLVSVPLRKQSDRPIIFNKDDVELTFIAERSKNEPGLRYIGCESQLVGEVVHLRVFLLASMDLDVRMIDILPYVVEE